MASPQSRVFQVFVALSIFLLQGCGPEALKPSASGEGHDPRGELRNDKGEPRPDNAVAANFRGAIAIDRILRDRLMAEDSSFSLGPYLSSFIGSRVSGIAKLLGYHAGEGTNAEFRNGKPNAVNMVLWHMALSDLARDIARQCAPGQNGGTPPTQIELRPALKKALAALCHWPAPRAQNAEAVGRLWNVVMADDAPNGEFEAFRSYALGETLRHAPAPKAVAHLITGMLLNPHFLIRH